MTLQKNIDTAINLEASIRDGNLKVATGLLRSGADANQRNSEGLSFLMIASGLGQSRMVELLLTAGADVFIVEPRMGATALHKAAQSGNPDVIKLLLDKGAFIDQQSPIFGNTPLMDAVWHKNEAAVECLLERGARTTPGNHYQETALDIAKTGGLDSITRLLEARNQAGAKQISAQKLMMAVKAGNIDEVKRILKSGVNLNERSPITGDYDDDYTPLGVAARDGYVEIVRLLLDAGADPRRTNGLMKATPVHEAAYEGRADVIRALVERSSHSGVPALELDAQGVYNGLTALHDAIWHGHLEAARALIEAGAPLDLLTHTGLTPKGLAVVYGYSDIADLLDTAGSA